MVSFERKNARTENGSRIVERPEDRWRQSPPYRRKSDSETRGKLPVRRERLRGGQAGEPREPQGKLAEQARQRKSGREPDEYAARRLRDDRRHFQELQP